MPDPVLASVEDQIRSRALVTLHGSQTVRESYESFDSAMRAFWAHATEMRHDGAGRNLWLELEAARTVVRTRMIDLGTVMRDDIDLLPGA